MGHNNFPLVSLLWSPKFVGKMKQCIESTYNKTKHVVIHIYLQKKKKNLKHILSGLLPLFLIGMCSLQVSILLLIDPIIDRNHDTLMSSIQLY